MATPESLASLLKQTEIADHEQILKECNAILKQTPNDVKTKHVKAIALLKLDRYSDALEVFEKASQLQEKAPVDYAYSLYRGGQPKRAAEVASAQTERGARHVEAQALYRREDFGGAAAIYNELSSTPEEQGDLRINRRAVEAQSIWAGLASDLAKPDRQDLEGFETAYNAACSSIARGQLKQAEVLLTRAKELCKHSEDLSDGEKAAELLPISVQQLHVLKTLGKNEQAVVVAKEINQSEISDAATRVISSHNLLALQSDGNPFLAQKALANLTFKAGDEPFRYQSHLLTHNSRVVDIQSLKHEGVARSTTKILESDDVRAAVSASLFNAVAHTSLKGLSGKPLLKELRRALEKSPSNIGLRLAIIQLELAENRGASASHVLEPLLRDINANTPSTDPKSHTSEATKSHTSESTPGLIALQSALLLHQGQKSASTHLLSLAAQQHLTHPTPSTALLQAAGAAILLDPTAPPSSMQTAQTILSHLHALNPSDPLTRAGHTACHPPRTPTKPPTPVTSAIDPAALEAQGIPSLSHPQKAATNKRPAPSTSTAPAKKRIRPSHIPKKKDELVAKGEWGAPDPERWLPLRDRKGFRAKKRRGGRASRVGTRRRAGWWRKGEGRGRRW